MDSYIRGVVAGEMPSSWPLEALKVQAVAARTYALSTAKTTGAFDQYPDTRSQMYRGVTGESVRSDAAVADTARRDRHLRRRAGGDLLLLHLGRPDGERGVLVHRLAVEALARERAGPVRQPVARTTAGPCASRPPVSTVRWAPPGAFKRLKVTERGESPRVVRAKVVGTARHPHRDRAAGAHGPRPARHVVHRLPGSQLLRAPRARPARRAGARGREPPARWPAHSSPRRARTCSESSAAARRGQWHFVARARTSRSGRYRVTLTRSGVYRVTYGAVKGPAGPHPLVRQCRRSTYERRRGRGSARPVSGAAFSTEPESNGRLGVVLDAELDRLRHLGPGDLRGQHQAHVDAR